MSTLPPRLAGFLLAGALLAGCAGDGDAPRTAAAGADPATVVGAPADGVSAATVELVRFAFVPGQVEIAAGEIVAFVNADQTLHTVTAEDGRSFDVELGGRGTVAHVRFDEPGVYDFACRPHEFMTGTVTVTDS